MNMVSLCKFDVCGCTMLYITFKCGCTICTLIFPLDPISMDSGELQSLDKGRGAATTTPWSLPKKTTFFQLQSLGGP